MIERRPARIIARRLDEIGQNGIDLVSKIKRIFDQSDHQRAGFSC
jgi:hypothetical protein